MTSEPEMYLAKAKECLAAARADLEAGRYNSVANRAYYASFQAAVAALIATGVRRKTGSWEHRFVLSEFSGKLVSTRKALPGRFRTTLGKLLELRVVGDYRPQQVRVSEGRRALREASALVEGVSVWLEGVDRRSGS